MNKKTKAGLGENLLLSSRSSYFVDTRPKYLSGSPQGYFLPNIASGGNAQQSDESNDAYFAIDGSYSSCTSSTEWLQVDLLKETLIDSVTIYGSTMYPEKGRFLDVSICNAGKDPCTLCKAGLNVGDKTLQPARRISCNLAGQIITYSKIR